MSCTRQSENQIGLQCEKKIVVVAVKLSSRARAWQEESTGRVVGNMKVWVYRRRARMGGSVRGVSERTKKFIYHTRKGDSSWTRDNREESTWHIYIKQIAEAATRAADTRSLADQCSPSHHALPYSPGRPPLPTTLSPTHQVTLLFPPRPSQHHALSTHLHTTTPSVRTSSLALSTHLSTSTFSPPSSLLTHLPYLPPNHYTLFTFLTTTTPFLTSFQLPPPKIPL